MGRWVCIKHVAYEGPAGWADTFEAMDLPFDVCEVGRDALPEPGDPDLGGVLVLGGPMHVLDDHLHPWLEPERRLLAELHERHVPVIGVCLGAQLVAVALGGSVERGGHTELGMGGIEWTDAARRTFGEPLPAEVLHWHDDGIVSDTGVRLAGTRTTPWQALATPSGLLVQFHIEIRPGDVATIAPHLPAGMRIDQRALVANQAVWADLRRRMVSHLLASTEREPAHSRAGADGNRR